MRSMSLMALVTVSLAAQGPESKRFKPLPDWARPHAEQAATESVPEGADAWVLLDRTEFAYTGGGEIRKRTFRLVRVLTERGTREGTFLFHGLGGKAIRLKGLKGWNLRPDGDVTRLDKEGTVAVSLDQGTALTGNLSTFGTLDRVVAGSLVAFESQEVIQHPMGPTAMTFILEQDPIRCWELQVNKEIWHYLISSEKNVHLLLEPRNLSPWVTAPEVRPDGIRLMRVPAAPRDEAMAPHPRNGLPWVSIRVLDPKAGEVPSSATWNDLGLWLQARYRKLIQPQILPDLALPSAPADRLRAVHDWIRRHMEYRQIYLQPERGWIPEAAGETLRHRFGDCKDLATLLLGAAEHAGWKGHPVLCRIVDGHVSEDEPVSPFAFNHAISALELPQSLGLPAEVEVGGRRMLLVDPTSRLTPLGLLPGVHRGRRLLVCTEKGAHWVTVPPGATPPGSISTELTGKVELDGAFKGTMRFREEHDEWDLRSTLLTGGRQGLEKAMRVWMDLPPGAKLAVLEAGDVYASDRPLEVSISLEHPRLLQQVGRDRKLEAVGLPGLIALAQKAGSSRRQPLLSTGLGTWAWEARLEVPLGFRLASEGGGFETPFRKVTWKGSLEGGRLHIRFSQERREAWFGLDRLEEGVRAQKQDRSQWRTLRTDGLTLVPEPPTSH